MQRIEKALVSFEDELHEAKMTKAAAERTLADYLPKRNDDGFDLQLVLDDKERELDALLDDLAGKKKSEEPELPELPEEVLAA